MFKENRIGTIEISGGLILGNLCNTDDLLLVFGRLVVLRCEHMVLRDVFKIEAYSPDFDIVPNGSMPPEYIAIITTHENGRPSSVVFKKLT